jgi:hypothetical protein
MYQENKTIQIVWQFQKSALHGFAGRTIRFMGSVAGNPIHGFINRTCRFVGSLIRPAGSWVHRPDRPIHGFIGWTCWFAGSSVGPVYDQTDRPANSLVVLFCLVRQILQVKSFNNKLSREEELHLKKPHTPFGLWSRHTTYFHKI